MNLRPTSSLLSVTGLVIAALLLSSCMSVEQNSSRTTRGKRSVSSGRVNPLVMKNIPGIRIWRPIRTPVPFENHSIKRAAASRHPYSVKLFERAGADGAVAFYDYYETRVPSLGKNWWWPLNYWTVAAIKDPGDIPPLAPESRAYFYGGWQIYQ